MPVRALAESDIDARRCPETLTLQEWRTVCLALGATWNPGLPHELAGAFNASALLRRGAGRPPLLHLMESAYDSRGG